MLSIHSLECHAGVRAHGAEGHTSRRLHAHGTVLWETSLVFLCQGLERSSNISSWSHFCISTACNLQHSYLYEIIPHRCIFLNIYLYFWMLEVYATHLMWPQFCCMLWAMPLLCKSQWHNAYWLNYYLLCVCLGSKWEGWGRWGWGVGSAGRKVGGSSPGMFGWNLELLCSEEGSDQHPEVMRRDFSGALEAAGRASRMKIWKR